MIVISQIQRLFVKLPQPLRLTLTLIPATELTFALTPYHLNRNRTMKKAIAPAPMMR